MTAAEILARTLIVMAILGYATLAIIITINREGNRRALASQRHRRQPHTSTERQGL